MNKFSCIRWTVLLLAFLVILPPAFAADPPLPVPVGRVVWVKGMFKAMMGNKEERSLQKTSVIYLHDTLVTAAASQAQIVFTDSSLMTFRENTNFAIDKYSFSAKNKKGSAGSYVMRVIEGGFRTITGLVAKDNPENYQVNTPVATIGVRGTDFSVYYHNGELVVGRLEGTPCVTNSGVKKTKLCLDETNKYTQVRNGEAPVPLQQRPAVFDELLTIVAAKITPFSYPGSGGRSSGGGVTNSFCISQ